MFLLHIICCIFRSTSLLLVLLLSVCLASLYFCHSFFVPLSISISPPLSLAICISIPITPSPLSVYFFVSICLRPRLCLSLVVRIYFIRTFLFPIYLSLLSLSPYLSISANLSIGFMHIRNN